MPPKRIDSLGRITEPLAVHLWENSWSPKRPHIDWNPKQLIVHASGHSRNEAVFTEMKSREHACSVPPEATIITYSDLKHGPYFLERQLKKNNIPYLVAKIDGKYHSQPFWQKLLALKDVSLQVKTKWILSLDNFDVILQGDLWPLIHYAEDRGFNAFFGAEFWHWPPDCPTKEKESLNHFDSTFRHLNAGVSLLKTVWLNALLEPVTDPVDDQDFFKRVYVKQYPKVDIDHEAKFVLNLNGTLPPLTRLPKEARHPSLVSPQNRYEVFVLTQNHRQDMAKRMLSSLLDHACEKPKRIVVASLEDISNENWGPSVEVWSGSERLQSELLNAGLSEDAFNRIIGKGKGWDWGNGHMFLKYAIPRLCMGERVLVSDDDVIFRGPCFELFESQADLIFMEDPPNFYGEESVRLFLEKGWTQEPPVGPFLCAGFYLINKKQATPEMVNIVILNAKNHRDEQSAVGMEAMMGSIEVLQQPKYIHGGQVCDGRISKDHKNWIDDAEVIHMQGDLSYLRDKKFDNPLKEKLLFVTSAFFNIRNDRPASYYFEPLNYFTEKMHHSNHLMVFTNRPEFITKRGNVDVHVCEPEELIKDIWGEEDWLPLYTDLILKDPKYCNTIQAKSRAILVWNSKIAAISRASKIAQNVVWIDAGRHISCYCEHNLSRFMASEFKDIPDALFSKRICDALTKTPIIMRGFLSRVYDMPMFGDRLVVYCRRLGGNEDESVYFCGDFMAIQGSLVERFCLRFKNWWSVLLEDGVAGTEETVYTILGWEYRNIGCLTQKELTSILITSPC